MNIPKGFDLISSIKNVLFRPYVELLNISCSMEPLFEDVPHVVSVMNVELKACPLNATFASTRARCEARDGTIGLSRPTEVKGDSYHQD